MFCKSLTKCQYQGANTSYQHPTQKLCKPADESVHPKMSCSISGNIFLCLRLFCYHLKPQPGFKPTSVELHVPETFQRTVYQLSYRASSRTIFKIFCSWVYGNSIPYNKNFFIATGFTHRASLESAQALWCTVFFVTT